MKRQPRIKDEEHCEFIRSLPCISCHDNTSTECAHIRFSDIRVAKVNPGVGQKPDDKFTVPLCSSCHRRQHEMGRERDFWYLAHIDPILYALALYAVSGDYEKGYQIVMMAGEIEPANILVDG